MRGKRHWGWDSRLSFTPLIGLSKLRLSVARSTELWLAPLVGLVTGVITAATGVFVLPALPYLQAIGLEKDELVQALGLHFTVSTLALAAVLLYGGAFPSSIAMTSLLAVLPALAGMYLGQRLRQRIPVATFQLCLFLGLLASGTATDPAKSALMRQSS